MAGGSTKVVVFALFANLGIAIAKTVAAVITKSGAMLAEAIHSYADTGNQVLLLIGGARAKREPDERHPLGYGRESYFWALLVAVFLFSAGGLFSAYEGWHKLHEPEMIQSPGWAISVLLLGVVLEGGSLWVAWRECKRVRGTMGLLPWARRTGDVNLLVVTFEDLAAMAGLIIALLAVLLTMWTENPLCDAIGTLVLAVLLLTVALFLGAQVRRLIAGSAASPELAEEVRGIWHAHGFEVPRMIAVWSGPGQILVACKVKPNDLDVSAQETIDRVNAAEAAVRAQVEELGFLFSELDDHA